MRGPRRMPDIACTEQINPSTPHFQRLVTSLEGKFVFKSIPDIFRICVVTSYVISVFFSVDLSCATRSESKFFASVMFQYKSRKRVQTAVTGHVPHRKLGNQTETCAVMNDTICTVLLEGKTAVVIGTLN